MTLRDMVAGMLPDKRLKLILRDLQAGGVGTVTSLATEVGVSQATIRRDLKQLADEGLVRRVYGGALPVFGSDDPFAEVAAVRTQEKDAIAARCVDLITDGETVLIDIGTTAHRVAKKLHGRQLTVITSSLAVLEELEGDLDIRLVLLGGMLRREYRSLVGFLTQDNIHQLHADRLILGASGIRPDGQVMDTTVVEVPVKRAMIAASDQVMLVADLDKFPGIGMSRVCGPEDIDVVVTNSPADPTTVAALTSAGVDVVEVRA